MAKNPLDLFPIIAPTLEETGIEYAVGGGVAMAAHGFVRTTEDIDVFFKHEDGPEFLRALRKARIKFATIADPYHYAIIPDAEYPDHRIDLLFTSDDPEWDAVEWCEEASVEVKGRRMRINVFPAVLLVTVKARSTRGKDQSDVRRMYEAGLGSVSVTDATRRALRASQGCKGLATREELRRHIVLFGTDDLANVLKRSNEEDAHIEHGTLEGDS